MSDRSIHEEINELVAAERELRDRLSRGEISVGAEHARLHEIGTQLDQCWDLLRQRDAKREFGEDPDTAEVRPPGVVEDYRG